jgi:hypothetical protein
VELQPHDLAILIELFHGDIHTNVQFGYLGSDTESTYSGVVCISYTVCMRAVPGET